MSLAMIYQISTLMCIHGRCEQTTSALRFFLHYVNLLKLDSYYCLSCLNFSTQTRQFLFNSWVVNYYKLAFNYHYFITYCCSLKHFLKIS